MKKRKCVSKTKGGRCLLYESALEADKAAAQTEDKSKDTLQSIDLPKKIEIPELMIYKEPKINKVEPTSELKKSGVTLGGEDVHYVDTDYHKAQNKLADVQSKTKTLNKGLVKGNLILEAIDVANFVYENRDAIGEVSDVVDLAEQYAEEAVSGLASLAPVILGEASRLESADALSGLVGAPLIARTIDNVGDIFDVDVGAERALDDAIEWFVDSTQPIHDFGESIGVIPNNPTSIANPIVNITANALGAVIPNEIKDAIGQAGNAVVDTVSNWVKSWF